MQSKRAKFICYPLFLLLLHLTASSQLSIVGPICVVTGTEYQYNLSGNLSGSSSMQWCITGGTIIGSNNACFTGDSKFIRVKWQDPASGNLKIIVSGSSATINITITKAFKAGSINTSSMIQDI